MKNIQRSVRATCVATLGLFAALLSSAVLADDGVELKSTAFEEVEVVQPNGVKQKKLQPLAKAVPGQQVIYETTYQNHGKKAAEKVVIKNPVPAQLAYVPGSAQGAGTRIEVSVDGGTQFGQLEKLTVAGADGKPRAALPEDVTTLRWTVTSPVQPGGQGKVTYRARLK